MQPPFLDFKLLRSTIRTERCSLFGFPLLRSCAERLLVIITRGFSLTNFIIASSALGFQVCVLYPWHHKLEEDFKQLKDRTSPSVAGG